MAVFHGKTAKVTFTGGAGTITAITGWSVSTSSDVAESTAVQSSGYWQSFEVGFKDASATVDGNGRKTRDTIAQIGSEASIDLYIDDTSYFSFNAICIGIVETASKDDIGKISYSFEMDDGSGLAYNAS